MMIDEATDWKKIVLPLSCGAGTREPYQQHSSGLNIPPLRFSALYGGAGICPFTGLLQDQSYCLGKSLRSTGRDEEAKHCIFHSKMKIFIEWGENKAFSGNCAQATTSVPTQAVHKPLWSERSQDIKELRTMPWHIGSPYIKPSRTTPELLGCHPWWQDGSILGAANPPRPVPGRAEALGLWFRLWASLSQSPGKLPRLLIL